jgi:hypothetical protein
MSSMNTINKIKEVEPPPSGRDVTNIDTPLSFRLLTAAVFATAMFLLFFTAHKSFDGGIAAHLAIWVAYLALLLRVTQQSLKRGSWISFAISPHGVFLPSVNTGRFVLIPWPFVRDVEISTFGVFSKGFRFEINAQNGASLIANQMPTPHDPKSLYAAVKSDVRNREAIMEQIHRFKDSGQQST